MLCNLNLYVSAKKLQPMESLPKTKVRKAKAKAGDGFDEAAKCKTRNRHGYRAKDPYQRLRDVGIMRQNILLEPCISIRGLVRPSERVKNPEHVKSRYTTFHVAYC